MAIGVSAIGLHIGLSLVFLAGFSALDWAPHYGLALSNSLATTAEMIVLLGLIRRRLAGLEGRRMAASLARMAVSASVMGAYAAVLAWWLDGTSAWLSAGLSILVGVALYGGISLLLGTPEPHAVWRLVRTKRRT